MIVFCILVRTQGVVAVKRPGSGCPTSVHIVLLRAINIGGCSVVTADLRAMLADLGCENPRTLLHSGNAVFAVKTKASTAALEAKLEAEAPRRFGMPS